MDGCAGRYITNERREQIDEKKTENTERTRQRALNEYYTGMTFRNRSPNGVESVFLKSPFGFLPYSVCDRSRRRWRRWCYLQVGDTMANNNFIILY